MENREMVIDYVPQREFDIYIQNIKERADSDKELTAERFDKFQAVMEKNFSEMKAEIKRVEDTVSVAVMGLSDRFDDMKDYQNKWFTVFGILFTVITVAFSVVAFFK